MNTRLYALVPVLLMAGCATFEPEPVSLPLTPPDQWAHEDTSGATVDADWWQAFDDAHLNRLIDRAIAANPGLAATAESVIQADLQLRNAGAALLPSVSASASSGRRSLKSAGAGLGYRRLHQCRSCRGL